MKKLTKLRKLIDKIPDEKLRVKISLLLTQVMDEQFQEFHAHLTWEIEPVIK